MKVRSFGILSLLALTACVYLPLGTMSKLPAEQLAAGGGITLNVKPSIQIGGYTTMNQVIVNPYSSADVGHVVVRLLKVTNGNEIPMVNARGEALEYDLLPASFSTQLSFSGLSPNTNYRIRAYAYKSATGSLDADKLSNDTRSSLDVPLTNITNPTLQLIPIQLIDRIFNASGTSSLQFATGSVLNPSTNEAIN